MVNPEKIEFFVEQQLSKNLNDFANELPKIRVNLETNQKLESIILVDAIHTIIKYILKKPSYWDDNCQFNIRHVGDTLRGKLKSYNSDDDNYLPDLFVVFYRFAKELEFNTPIDRNLSSALLDAINVVRDGKIQLSWVLSSQLTYAALDMPASIVKERLSHPNLKSVEQFDDTLVKAEALKLQWDDEIQKREENLDIIQKRLEEQKTAFNFVGLDKAFQQLESKKQGGYYLSQFILTILALAILGVLVAQVVLIWDVIQNNQHYLNQKDNGIVPMFVHQVDLNQYAYLILPTLAIEIILIYFFRVVLSNYHSLKAQILQIELRRSLCQFIQSYADYAKEINDKSAGTLERFEQIIFSGIVSDPDKVTTFDGVESLANVVKAIRG